MFTVLILHNDDFYDFEYFKNKIDYYLKNKDQVTIVSNKGSFGIQYAKLNNLPYRELSTFTFVSDVDAAIMFWNGLDFKMKVFIEFCLNKGIPLKTVRFDKLPLIAYVSYKKGFNSKVYTHNNKPLNNLKHLDNWLNTFDKRGYKVTHLDYKFVDKL